MPHGRIQIIAATAVVAFALAGCGPSDGATSGLMQLDGSVVTARSQAINFALDENPSSMDPDSFKLLAAAPLSLQPGSLRFCFGELVACQSGAGLSVAGVAQTINSQTIYVSEKYVKLSADLKVHVVARSNVGADLVASYQVKAKGSTSTIETPQSNTEQGAESNECFGAPNDLVCQVELAVWRMTNEKRQSQGKQPFAFAKKIGCASRLWSVEQARRGRISHDWFGNGELKRKYVGECQGTGSISSENVAMSGAAGSDAEAIASVFVEMWWRSPGHKTNMLGNQPGMGVGFARTGNTWYGTQNMGSE